MSVAGVERRALIADLSGLHADAEKQVDPFSKRVVLWSHHFVEQLRKQEDVAHVKSCFIPVLHKILQDPLYQEAMSEKAVLAKDGLCYDPLLVRLWTLQTGVQIPIASEWTSRHPLVGRCIQLLNSQNCAPVAGPRRLEAISLDQQGKLPLLVTDESEEIDAWTEMESARDEKFSQELDLLEKKARIAETKAKQVLDDAFQQLEDMFLQQVDPPLKKEAAQSKALQQQIARLEQNIKDLEQERKALDLKIQENEKLIAMTGNRVLQIEKAAAEMEKAVNELKQNETSGLWMALGSIAICAGASWAMSGTGCSVTPQAGGGGLLNYKVVF